MTTHVRRGSQAALLILSIGLGAASAEPAAWKDPSLHQVQFITVEPGVRLEVLD